MLKKFCLLIAGVCLLTTPLFAGTTNGLAVTFRDATGKTADMLVVPNLWLYVERGQTAAPFVAPGAFTAEFQGAVNAELRGNFLFIAEELRGEIKLEINGAVVLDTSTARTVSKPVQLNKGPNTIRALFTSPASGDAALRVGWAEKGTNANPIPNALLTHGDSAGLKQAEALHVGRELFLEHRCVRCHTEKISSPIPDLAMDAPTFDGMGARRGEAWLAQWILNPKTNRSSATMPALLHGPAAAQDAEAIAAYLRSLSTDSSAAATGSLLPVVDVAARPSDNKAVLEIAKRSGPAAKATLGESEENPAPTDRKPIFERLHCTACHSAPSEAKQDPTKISLKHVAQKFEKELNLRAFLQAPEKHFTWIRMPNFKLADVEAEELAAYLFKHADKLTTAKAADEKLRLRGKELVQSLGCLNCHTASGIDNKFSAPALAKLAKDAKGCLAEQQPDTSKAARFGFSAEQRAALVAFLKTDLSSLSRHSPIEFASRETRLLQCNACHGQIELVPPLDVMGGKLKPEWAARFIAGTPAKVRADIHPKGGVWIDSRMPGFRTRAELLAQGMAQQQGYAPRTAEEGPIDEAAAKIGHKLVGKDNGLSCISCHAVNDMPALEVFESEGTNLGLTGERLLKPFFFRWMRNPLSVDPTTKMPAFFDETGKSALTDYYDGDAEQQINALYQYIRMAGKMPKPITGLE